MTSLLNPLEQAVVESCAERWLLRSEIVEELDTLTDAEAIEKTIEFLIQRRLLERLAISSIAYGHNCFRTTNLGRRMLARHHRRLSGTPVSAVRRGLHLV